MTELVLFTTKLVYGFMEVMGYLMLLVSTFSFLNRFVSRIYSGNDSTSYMVLIFFLALMLVPVYLVVVNSIPTLNFNIYEFIGYNLAMALGIYLLVKFCMKIQYKKYSESFSFISHFAVYFIYAVFITITLLCIKNVGGNAVTLRFMVMFATWGITNVFVFAKIKEIEYYI